jgi:glycosyltransferase involved in cell wall biosynthesis
MNIGFYNPYFDGFGGGERYVLTLASHWSKQHTVDLFWDNSNKILESENRFGLDLSRIRVVPNIFRSGNIFQKARASRNYDVIFFLTDGSVPTSCAKHNILHIQVPFRFMRIPFYKKHRISAIVCNSQFTKDHIDTTLARDAQVIYPPISMDKFMPGEKTKTILSVGRFSAAYQAKKQEVLLSTFQQGIRSGALKGYSLVLAGGLLESDDAYFTSLKDMAKGFPVTFFAKCPFRDLQRLYATAMIYWHAAGYGESEPEHMEHFGISTVEAMRAGCVPVVYRGGGQPEIVTDNENGYLFDTKEELLTKTMHLIENEEKRRSLAKKARLKALDFSTDHFCQKYDTLLTTICR